MTNLVELHPCGEAGRHVHRADERTRRVDSAHGDSDQLRVKEKGKLHPIRSIVMIGNAHRCTVPDLVGIGHEELWIGTLHGAQVRPVHAFSRSAVRRMSAIMLGITCVRLELSWFLRSNGASVPSISVARICPALRSWTARKISANMPLVMAE